MLWSNSWTANSWSDSPGGVETYGNVNRNSATYHSTLHPFSDATLAVANRGMGWGAILFAVHQMWTRVNSRLYGECGPFSSTCTQSLFSESGRDRWSTEAGRLCGPRAFSITAVTRLSSSVSRFRWASSIAASPHTKRDAALFPKVPDLTCAGAAMKVSR